MSEVTYYVALPFVAADDGIAAGEPTECFNPNAAVMRAEALSRKEGHVGAVAFSRTGDPATGDFSDAKVIRKFGDVPPTEHALGNCWAAGAAVQANRRSAGESASATEWCKARSGSDVIRNGVTISIHATQ
jgi:hypothetical protein